MDQAHFSAWNPGIDSEIPTEYRELETIYDPANVFTTISEVNNLAIETGLAREELISFRPHRLVLHELLVRITADIAVPEGDTEEDLGQDLIVEDPEVGISIVEDPDLTRRAAEIREGQEARSLEVRIIGIKVKKLLNMCLKSIRLIDLTLKQQSQYLLDLQIIEGCSFKDIMVPVNQLI